MKESGEAFITSITVQNLFPICPFKISPEGYIVKLFCIQFCQKKGLLVESYTTKSTGKWSAISTAILPLVQAEAKFEWIWYIHVLVVSVIRVA